MTREKKANTSKQNGTASTRSKNDPPPTPHPRYTPPRPHFRPTKSRNASLNRFKQQKRLTVTLFIQKNKFKKASSHKKKKAQYITGGGWGWGWAIYQFLLIMVWFSIPPPPPRPPRSLRSGNHANRRSHNVVYLKTPSLNCASQKHTWEISCRPRTTTTPIVERVIKTPAAAANARIKRRRNQRTNALLTRQETKPSTHNNTPPARIPSALLGSRATPSLGRAPLTQTLGNTSSPQDYTPSLPSSLATKQKTHQIQDEKKKKETKEEKEQERYRRSTRGGLQ